MVSKILFYFPKLEPYKDYHYMPISALAVSAELLAQGHKVKIFDQRVDDPTLLMNEIKNANEIMITCYTGYQLSQGYEFARSVKMHFPHKKIIMGGPHVTALPEQTLTSVYIDEVITGEVDTGKYPLPYHLIDVHKYINPDTKRFIYITSYGCPGKCTFCSTKKKRPFKLLHMVKVEKDIDYLMSAYPFKECVLFDATAFSFPDRIVQISNIMQKHDLGWIADARAPEIARLDIFTLHNLANNGLKQVTIGLESGSQRIIENMKKGIYHLRDFKQAAENLADTQIKLVSGVVFGTPGETVFDLLQTIEYINRIVEVNPNYRISTTFFRPLPDTIMGDMAKKYGYMEPETIEEWAELGQYNHYSYNEFSEAPWIEQIDKYRQIYEDFRKEYAEIFV